MSWDEWIFDKAYKLIKKQKQLKKSHTQTSLSSYQRSMEIAFEALTKQTITIQEAQDFTGFYKGHLFLPATIDLLENQELNRKLYWLLLCFHANAVTHQGFSRSVFSKIIEKTITNFPGLDECVQALRKLETEELGSFKINSWLGNPPVLDTPVLEKTNPLEKNNSLDAESITQTIQKKGSNVVQIKELKDSEENPLVHMFEKVNTAESYQGGNKAKQAEDSLENMEEALQEIQLRTVIRSTERTPGLIKSNSIIESNGISEDPDEFENRNKTIFYPEWDQSKRQYREKWCSVNIVTSPEKNILKVKTPEGQKLKQRFESLFNHFLWEGNQWEGSELDLRPIIENQISKLKGGALRDRIYLKRIDQVRDFQVLIMMDESLSTESFLGKESVLGMMKASIGDLSQAFESSPDQLSIMSFFSETRLHCSVKILKDFSESIEAGQARLSKCKPQGYTRIGVAIRHAIATMKKSTAKRRCIVLLTDAKPTDVDRYEGRYGMDDVRKTVEELKLEGLELMVISYSEKNGDRFERMFSKHTHIHHATTKKEITIGLTEIIERLAVAR